MHAWDAAKFQMATGMLECTIAVLEFLIHGNHNRLSYGMHAAIQIL